MIQFLTSTSTVRLIEQIVIDAEDNLVLASASPSFSAKLTEYIESASRRGVSITLMVDDVLFDENKARSVVNLENVSLCPCPDLNGHCYANEYSMLVTSMGLLDPIPTGEHMGVFFSADEQAFSEALSVLQEIRNAATVPQSEKPHRSVRRNGSVDKKANRSPFMQVIRGGLKGRLKRNGQDSAKPRLCAACNSRLGDVLSESAVAAAVNSSGESLCTSCVERNKYQHTSLYLASDLTA